MPAGRASNPSAIAECRSLVLGRYCFSLPRELLEAVVDEVGEERFDPDLLAFDRQLATVSGDHSGWVGLRNGLPFRYDLLGDPQSLPVAFAEMPPEERAELNGPGSFCNNLTAQNLVEKRLTWMRDVRRGFAGWLVLNAAFQKEQRDFFVQWRNEIAIYGLESAGRHANDTRTTMAPLSSPPERFPAFAAARRAFLDRWRLDGMAAPFLPEVAGPQAPLVNPGNLAHLASIGTIVFFPDVLPLPDRASLRGMIEDAMARTAAPAQLREWSGLVDGDNPGKRRITRYARLFRLQHYWRALFSRHAAAMKGKVGRVRIAFACFLFPQSDRTPAEEKAESIRKDLSEIARARGGRDWWRPISLYDRLL